MTNLNMSKETIISFIIPAYNASSTIVRCLDSIYTLSLKEDDFEVIVVDDCSIDNTVAVIEDYAKSHSNLILLRQKENHRQGAARNRGVKIAQGQYISFVDADDETDVGIVEAVSLARKSQLDIVVLHYTYINHLGEINETEPICLPICSGIEFTSKAKGWSWAPWSYLFCRAFLHKVNYPFAEDVLFEDADFVGIHMYYASRIGCCSTCSYKMHSTSGSTTRTLTFLHATDRILLGIRNRNFSYICSIKNPINYAYYQKMLHGASTNINIGCHLLPKMKKGGGKYCAFTKD